MDTTGRREGRATSGSRKDEIRRMHELPHGQISTTWVPRWVLDRSWQMLRQDGLKGVESTVLWGGRRFGSEAVVMAVVYPCGPDVALEPGYVHVGADTTAEMGRWLRAQSLTALAQVHTHPGGWTGHSPTDSDFSIASSEGFLSLVWPHYAARPVATTSELGIHQLLGGRWEMLGPADAAERVQIVESEAMLWVPREAPAPSLAKGARGTGAALRAPEETGGDVGQEQGEHGGS